MGEQDPGSRQALARTATLIGEFDSTEQFAIFDETRSAPDAPMQPARAIRRLTGLLRTGLLVSDVVYLTDAMIFDGPYFAEIGPEDLGRELGMSSWHVPIVVLSRPVLGPDGEPAADFAEAFRSRLRNRAFVWQLRKYGYSRRQIRAHGERWIAAYERGLFDVVPWGGPGEDPALFHADGFLTRDAAGEPPAMRTETGRRILAEQLAVAARSVLLTRLDGARRRAPAGTAERADIEDIEQWWLDAYLRELARRNGAGWVRFLGSSDEDPATVDAADEQELDTEARGGSGAAHRDAAERGAARRRLLERQARSDRADGVVQLRGDVIDVIAAASPPAFGAVRFSTRQHRERFTDRPSRWRLNAIAYAAVHQFDAPDRMRMLRSALLRAFFATGGTVLSTFAFPGLDDGLVYVVGFAVLVSTMPWSDLYESMRLMFLPPAARVMVGGSHRAGASDASARLKR